MTASRAISAVAQLLVIHRKTSAIDNI